MELVISLSECAYLQADIQQYSNTVIMKLDVHIALSSQTMED